MRASSWATYGTGYGIETKISLLKKCGGKRVQLSTIEEILPLT